jgi:ELWxxDGT repeat protein
VLFNSFDASDRVNLWVTDGTAAGTSELSVANVDTNDFDFGLLPQHFFVFGSEVLFSGEDANQLTGLWVTDGTSVGTSEISVAGANTSFGLEPFGFALLGSEVLFNGTDALSQQNLWVTDGTSAGTSELSVAHAASVGAGFSRPVVFSSGGSSEVLYASADLNNLGGLWVTDGTTAGTSELSVAGLGPAQGSPGDFIAFGSLFLFEGADANGHFNLWQTDGTAGGTSKFLFRVRLHSVYSTNSPPMSTSFRSAASCCLPATIAAAVTIFGSRTERSPALRSFPRPGPTRPTASFQYR